MPAPAARAYDGIWVEAATGTTLAKAIALRQREDEAAFSTRELCLVAWRGLFRQVDEGLGVVMEHQESTWGGGRSVVAGRGMGGSWKADKEGL
jgi:hypothetical protein